MNTIIITAADTKFFTLVQGTILSIREKPQGKDITIAFFDLGCTAKELEWMRSQVNIIKQPNWNFDFPSRSQSPEYLKGLLARPFLREYFPDFDVYLWIDADAWVQDWRAVELYIQGAAKRGLAIAPELDRAYSLPFGKLPWYWQFVRRDYETFFGTEVAEKFHTYPTLNAGVFALHCDAPHWQDWESKIREALQRSAGLMTDQVALNLLVYSQLFDRTELLPAWCNWSCNFGLPLWDRQQKCFVEPYLPHTQIGICHLTGRKHDRLPIKTTTGDAIEVTMQYQPNPDRTTNKIPSSIFTVNHRLEETINVTASTLSSDRDYISPGLQIIQPDRCFPNMIVGDTNGCKWKYLRREIIHNWYVDRRYPFVGFLSRDEAHILYNTALKFKGKRALEIGCWMGWSACHIALAGVNLEIIDPLLAQSPNQESVISSLSAAAKAFGTFEEVKLIAGYSPQKVDELAIQQQRKWSLIFIDGNHDAPYPLNDAIACEKYAEADTMILFHDLASPEVSQGLDYLRDRGWNTMIYQTMQIMGVAWRGNVEPVIHEPDPSINWQLPSHLEGYLVSSSQFLDLETSIERKNDPMNGTKTTQIRRPA
jgi:predicted O-methyltransferase YrrM